MILLQFSEVTPARYDQYASEAQVITDIKKTVKISTISSRPNFGFPSSSALFSATDGFGTCSIVYSRFP